MTVDLFIILATACCTISALLTEAIKKAVSEKTSSNIIALIDALVVGCGGSIISYILMGIPFNAQNIACIIIMGVVVWIGSMVGYDKVLQMVKQISSGKQAE